VKKRWNLLHTVIPFGFPLRRLSADIELDGAIMIPSNFDEIVAQQSSH
jgi:hypothetical protein